MSIEIEKGIPIPKGGSGRRKDPDSFAGKLRSMEVGDSVFIPKKNSTLAGSVAQARVQTGGDYVTRAIDGGTRIWRIK